MASNPSVNPYAQDMTAGTIRDLARELDEQHVPDDVPVGMRAVKGEPRLVVETRPSDAFPPMAAPKPTPARARRRTTTP